MWMVFAIGAILFAVCNVIFSMQKKDAKWFCFLSLSFTSLTLAACYQEEAALVSKQDFSALLDIMPSMSKILWIAVIASILINSISLFQKHQ